MGDISVKYDLPVPWLSVSQINLYKKCGYAHFLRYTEKAPQCTAAWLTQGVAVHEALEWWERQNREPHVSQVHDKALGAYARVLGEQLAKQPDMGMWFGSGPYDPHTDIERRRNLLGGQVERMMGIATKLNQQVWRTPTGELAVELPIECSLAGVPIKGFIDIVRVNTSGELVVTDYKTGKQPGDIFQLAVYALALEEQYGVDCHLGVYQMAHRKTPPKLTTISEQDRRDALETIQQAAEEISQGILPPNPDNGKNCMFCDVQYSCPYREEPDARW